MMAVVGAMARLVLSGTNFLDGMFEVLWLNDWCMCTSLTLFLVVTLKVI